MARVRVRARVRFRARVRVRVRARIRVRSRVRVRVRARVRFRVRARFRARLEGLRQVWSNPAPTPLLFFTGTPVHLSCSHLPAVAAPQRTHCGRRHCPAHGQRAFIWRLVF